MNNFAIQILKLLFSIGIIVCFSASCNKNERELKFYGSVFDSNQNKPMEGARIVLSGKNVEGGVYSPHFQEIASTTSDANGKFELTFEKKRTDSYKIYIFKNNYFSFEDIIPGSYFEAETSYEQNVILHPIGFITLNIKNQFPNSENDKIIFSFTNSVENCFDCCKNIEFEGLGTTFDTTFTCKFRGNKYAKIFYNVTKNNSTFVYVDSIFVEPFGTVTYNINY